MSPLRPESCFIRTENNDLHIDVLKEIGYSKTEYNF